MPDLTTETDIDTEWTDIATPLQLADGSTYVIDITRAESSALIYWAETDAASPPTVTGHPLKPEDLRSAVDTRELRKTAGAILWMRTSRGRAKITATKV